MKDCLEFIGSKQPLALDNGPIRIDWDIRNKIDFGRQPTPALERTDLARDEAGPSGSGLIVDQHM